MFNLKLIDGTVIECEIDDCDTIEDVDKKFSRRDFITAQHHNCAGHITDMLFPIKSIVYINEIKKLLD